MADSPQQHVFHLSSMDQSVPRQYITTAFTFPCDKEHNDKAKSGFISALKSTISWLPLLAGEVQTASSGDAALRGHVEVAVSLGMINAFAPVIKTHSRGDEGQFTYEKLREERFPSSKLEIEKFAARPQKPAQGACSAFAAQINIISGGLVVVLQLHHAVADLASLSSILKYLTFSAGPRPLDNEVLAGLAVSVSRARSALSHPGGLTPLAPAFSPQHPAVAFGEIVEPETVACVLAFPVSQLDGWTTTVNARYFDSQGTRRQSAVSNFDVLAAIVWRGVMRARLATSQLQMSITSPPFPVSKISIPVNIRERVQPELPAHYFGNAIAQGTSQQSIVELNMPIDVSGLKDTASLIRTAVGMVTERTVRLAIAQVQHSSYSATSTRKKPSGILDLNITSWSDLLPTEAHLSLGLGEPTFVRKLSRADGDEGCVIHPRPTEGAEFWEVTVSLNRTSLEYMLLDEGFMKFVRYADGQKFVNGKDEWLNLGDEINIEDERDRTRIREHFRGRQGFKGLPPIGTGTEGGSGAGGVQ